MKAFLLLFAFLFLSLPMIQAGEEVLIPTPYEQDVYLFVPEDPEELREYYIELATLYYDQRYDLDRSVRNVDDLIAQIDALRTAIREHKESLENVVVLLDQTRFFSRAFNIGVGFNFETLKPTYHVDLSYLITDRLQAGFGLEFPFAVRVFGGIRY